MQANTNFPRALVGVLSPKSSAKFSLCWMLILVIGLAGAVGAQDSKESSEKRADVAPKNGPAGTTEQSEAENAAVIKRVLERLDKVETELKQLKGRNGIKINPADAKVVVGLSEPYLGAYAAGGTNEIRYFAVRATVINLTNDPIKIQPDQWTLHADSAVRKVGDLPTRLSSMSFTYGNQSYSLRSLTTQALEVTPGRNGVTWLVFANLPKGTETPDLELSLRYGEKKEQKLDVVQYFGSQLDMKMERVGPRKALALVTIGGDLNTVSLRFLVKQFEELVANKVARVVLQWKKGAPKVDYQMMSWFRQIASSSGINTYRNANYPAMPAAITHFHLVDATNTSTSTRTVYRNGVRFTYQGNRNVHKTVHDAIQSALTTAYELVPRDELVEEIKSGHPLTRVAAVACGGGRLETKDLPILLQLTEDKDPQMQRAALKSLRHFGEPEAIAALMKYARKNQEPYTSAAIESLAGSRYSAAHQALVGLLKDETPKSRKTIVKVLGQYARPIWADTLYGFVKDKESGVRSEALAALVRVGHPELFPMLKEALEGSDSALSTAALTHLVAREDRESEQLATNWTLKHLEKGIPTSPMHQLLVRTKDQRAIEPLMKLLEKPGSHRSAVLNTLSQIGDERVGTKLVALYGQLSNSEKRTVLNTLHAQKSPAFYKLAAPALASSDYGLVSSVCSLLQNEADIRAVTLLKEGLGKQKNTSRFNYICNALSTIGSTEARNILQDAMKKETDKGRLSILKNSIQNLFQRSPGMMYVRNGQNYVKQKDLAKGLLHLNIAVEIDPELPEARRARGHALLQLEKATKEQLQLAKSDYEKFVAYDKDNSEGQTGLGLALIRLGDVQAGITRGEDAREKNKSNNIYLYNMACIYSRALEAVKADDKAEKRDELIKTYTENALRDLKDAHSKGFTDTKWMQEDPDMQALKDEAGFKAIIQKGATEPAGAPKVKKLPAIPQALR